MADPALPPMPNTITTQSTLSHTLSDPSQPQILATPGGGAQPPNPLAQGAPVPPVIAGVPADGAPQEPVKRKPGRPKGSGKKPIDPNSPPKIKRPVGRPRKDGLPAGSLGPRKPSMRPRKRPPGKFASGNPGIDGQDGFGSWSSSQWGGGESISAPVGRSDDLVYPIDPNIDGSDWVALSRSNGSAFLHSLISALAAPNPISTAGPSVEEAFKSHLVSLAPQQKQGATAIPSLYSILKTFWLPSSPAYFALTASASTARTPSEHKFLYWDPQPLVFNGIACPYCSAPLMNSGRIRSGPIKIYDLGKPFFIIACEYACKSPACAHLSPDGRKFSSVDLSIHRALPEKLRDEFPAHIMHSGTDLGSGPGVWNWRPMGVSKELWNMVRGCLRVGAKKDAILQVIRGIQEGVPDEFWKAEKEEEEGDEDEDAPDGAGPPEHEAEAEVEAELDESNSPDAYANAWKANSGTADPNASSPDGHAGPSNARGESAHPDAPHGYAHPPPYAGYPYAPYHPYSYYHQQQAGPFPVVPPPGGPPNGPPTTPAKRPYAFMEGTLDGSGGSMEPMHKRTRHCCKCGSPECKGKGGRAFCNNPCQDCGKLDCKGRNSKRPDKTCADAWN